MLPGSTARIMKALETMMSSSSSVDCSRQVIKHDVLLAALTASLCLVSGGDDHDAVDFNDDIARFGWRDSTLACA
jgi:hypothetical protein